MYKQAKDQLQKINVKDVKYTLLSKDKSFADSIQIDDDAQILRHNLYVVNYSVKSIKRQFFKATFPVDDSAFKFLNQNFSEFELEDGRCLIEESEIDILKKIEGFKLEELEGQPDVLHYPLETEDDNIINNQRVNYFHSLGSVESCAECKGATQVKCFDSDCKGRHTYKCTECTGKGTVGCETCHQTGKTTCSNCNGKGHVKCGSFIGSKVLQFNSRSKGCNGSGKVTIKDGDKKKSINCPTCRGKGTLKCNCSKGKVTCSKCKGKKKLTCGKCKGTKINICRYCNEMGMVDCSGCHAKGMIATIFYTSTTVEQDSKVISLGKGDPISFPDDLVSPAMNNYENVLPTYNELNKDITAENDEIAMDIIQEIRNLPVDYDGKLSHRLVEEFITYQIIPIIKLDYIHLVSKAQASLVVFNFFDAPVIQKLGNAKELDSGISNTGKSLKGFVGKLFKTKKHLAKVDNFNEVKLMIYLAKADGKMDEAEKLFLVKNIHDLNEFSNKEKEVLFDLIEMESLPPLIDQQISFSSKDKAKSVILKLEKLAQSDNDFSAIEKELIKEIKQIINL